MASASMSTGSLKSAMTPTSAINKVINNVQKNKETIVNNAKKTTGSGAGSAPTSTGSVKPTAPVNPTPEIKPTTPDTMSGGDLEKLMSQEDLAALANAGAKWNQATTQADKDAAHAEAEEIRKKYGYESTTASGAQVQKIGTSSGTQTQTQTTPITGGADRIDKIPDNATSVGIFGANGAIIGTGYIVDGKTYLKNADGSGTRLTNDTNNPIIVRTQGGDFVLSKDFGGSIDAYNKEYGMLPYQTKFEEQVTQTVTPNYIDYNTMDLDQIYDELMNAINTNDTSKLNDILTWAEAMAISTERNNPLYDRAIENQQKQYTNKALASGFYNQLPVEALWTQALAANEGERTQAIIDYAQQLYDSSRDDANQLYSLLQDDRALKIDSLLKILNYATDYNYNMAKLNAKDTEETTINKNGEVGSKTPSKTTNSKAPAGDPYSAVTIPDAMKNANVYRVGSDGQAPKGLKVGDYVVTGGGTVKITAVNADGTYKAVDAGKDITTSNYESLGGKFKTVPTGTNTTQQNGNFTTMNELDFAVLQTKIKNAINSGNSGEAMRLYNSNYDHLNEMQKDKLTILMKVGNSPYTQNLTNTSVPYAAINSNGR